VEIDMKWFIKLAGAALFAATLLPASASASAPGYVTTNLNVRAGPGTQFPALAVFPAGSRLTVHGCTRNVGWCDVTGRGVRGWVSGAYLEILHERRRVRPRHGYDYGLPTITFSIGRYWDDHYRDRHWHRDRSRYERSWRDGDRRRDDRGDRWRDDGRRSAQEPRFELRELQQAPQDILPQTRPSEQIVVEEERRERRRERGEYERSDFERGDGERWRDGEERGEARGERWRDR
jgi:uncharacterized protein YraI